MIEVLKKKASGYDVTEVTREYALDEDGNAKLVKEKTTTKHVPPDLSAIKAYLEWSDEEINKMSDEELRSEKERLLQELKNSQ